jgi:predicted amidohydrolase
MHYIWFTGVMALLALCITSAKPAENLIEPQSFVIAGLKIIPTQWDKEANLIKLEEWTRKAAAAGARLIVTPEGFLEGYVGNPNLAPDLTRERYYEIGEPIDGPGLQRVGVLARELQVHILIGFAERRGDEMYNSAVLFDTSGEQVAYYAKTHSGGTGEPYNRSGDVFPVFETELGRIGILICFDRQNPETARILALKGAQIILVPAYGRWTDDISEDILLRARAYENGVYVVHVHPWNTFVVDPEGSIISQSRWHEEGIVLAKIKLDDRIGGGPIRQRRPEIYNEILKEKAQFP